MVTLINITSFTVATARLSAYERLKNVFTFGGAKLKVAVTRNVNNFLLVCTHVAASALIDSIVVRYIKFSGRYVFISALELFDYLFFRSLAFLSWILHCMYLPLTPLGWCACIWLGYTFPFFPVGFLGFRIRRRTRLF